MVVIINGFPRSGKSEFVKQCIAVTHAEQVWEYSTVDFVKELATQCGWDGTKDAKNRKFLSDLKDLLTEWGNVPFKKACDVVTLHNTNAEYIGSTADKVVTFIHCREPQEIQKFVNYYGKAQCHTLLIRRPTVENIEQSNHADSQVLQYVYDTMIENSGTIEDLKKAAIKYLTQLVGKEILRDYSNNSNI